MTLLKEIVLCRFFKKMMKYLKILYRLLVYFTSFTACSGDIKKSSEISWSLSELFFLVSPTLNLKKKSCKSTNKKILASAFVVHIQTNQVFHDEACNIQPIYIVSLKISDVLSVH